MNRSDPFAAFRDQLVRALALPTQRAATRVEYAPELSYGRHAGPARPDAHQGAVLVLLFPTEEPRGWNIVLTVRTSHLTTHAGQVSFPGGRNELGESPEEAAIREFAEELGPLESYEIVGRLPEINVYASNFQVTPVVALTPERPRYVPSPDEVADILELPLSRLADRGRRGTHEVVRGWLRFTTPHLEIVGRQVWGATWIMLGELLERLEAIGPVA